MTTYYVSAAGGTGAGTSTGTSWSPAYALTKLNILVAGDSLLFNKGDTFYGNWVTQVSGTSGNIVTYGSYGTGANPILTGYTSLTPTISSSSWILYSSNVYYYSINVTTSAYVNNVTVDGAIHQQGRYPRNTWNTNTTCTATTITDPSIGTLPFNPTGGQVVNRKSRYQIDRNLISGVSGNTLTFTTDSIYGNNSTVPTATNGYFIQTHLGCLTTTGAQDGDWFYDAAAHRLYMYFTSTPTGRNIQISTIDNVLTLGQTYTTVNNIDIIGGQQTNVYIQSGAPPNNNIVNNCGIRQSGGNGIYIAQSGTITISNCTISDSLNNGIFGEYGNTTINITGNTVINSGLIRGAGLSTTGQQTGIGANATNITCTNNTVTNSGYNGIDFTSTGTGLIQYNRVDNFNLIKDDGGGIYTYEATGATIDSNIITNAIGCYDGSINAFYYEAYGKSAGIYLDNGVTAHNCIVSNNFASTGAWLGIFNNANGGNTITGNTVYNFALGQLAIVDADNPTIGLVINHNTLVSKAGQPCLTVIMELSGNINPSTYGTINNNIYARPSDDTTTIQIDKTNIGGNVTNISLATWKSTYTIDSASAKSAITGLDANLFYQYNYTASPVSHALSSTAKDVAGTLYTSSYTIPAYSGVVLLSSPIAGTGKLCLLAGRLVRLGGLIVKLP